VRSTSDGIRSTKGPTRSAAGVVDDDIGRSLSGLDRIKHGVDLSGLARVAFESPRAELIADSGQLARVSRGQRHLDAFGDKESGQCSAQASPRANDQGRFRLWQEMPPNWRWSMASALAVMTSDPRRLAQPQGVHADIPEQGTIFLSIELRFDWF